MTASIVAIGECMIEMARPRRSGWRMSFGGDSYNTALYLARLGHPTAFLTALGDDPFSAEMRTQWEEEGLDTSLVSTAPKRLPGLYAIRTDAAGEREFFYWREQAAVRELFKLDGIEIVLEKARGAKLLYLSGITLSLFGEDDQRRLVRLAQDVRARGGQVAFDPNYRARGWADPHAARAAIDAIAPYVSIAMPTYEDERVLQGDVDARATARRWRRLGATEIVVKMGPRGCLIDQDGEISAISPAAHILPVDTTGAGDSFNAGYLAARWSGRSRTAAADFANGLAGQVVQHPGAIIPASAMRYLPVAAESDGDLA